MDQIASLEEKKMIQERLLNAINMVQGNLENIQNNYMDNVIMLVGITGCGKSTIFNFLCGAKFKMIVDEDENSSLGLVQESEQFQQMRGGLNSTTKFPKLYYSQKYQHSIIDYPGFNDTEKKDQLEIQLLFNKIVTRNQIKIAYVLNNPVDQFQNKAEDLQNFINESQIDINKLTVIINSYCKSKSDEKLINDFQNQLYKKFERPAYQIIIQRDADSDEKIQKYFSDECRNNLWIKLIGSQVVQMKRYELNAYKDADNYISEKSYAIQKILINKIEQQKSRQYKTDQLEEFKNKINYLENQKSILKSFLDGNVNVLDQIMRYCDQFSEVEINATCRIYSFFYDSPNDVKQMDNYIKDVQNNLIYSIEFLNYKLQYLEQISIAEGRIKQIEEEKKIMKNEKREMEEMLQDQVKQINDELIKTKENLQNQVFEIRKSKDETQLSLNEQIRENKTLLEFKIKLEQELEVQKENEKGLNEELNYKIQEQIMINENLKKDYQRLDDKNKEIEQYYSQIVQQLVNSLDSTNKEVLELKKINEEIQQEKIRLQDQFSELKGQYKEIEADLKISRKEQDQQKVDFLKLKNNYNAQIIVLQDLTSQIQRRRQQNEQLEQQLKECQNQYNVLKKSFREKEFQEQQSIQNLTQTNKEFQKLLNEESKKQLSNSQSDCKIKGDQLRHQLKTKEEQSTDKLNRFISQLVQSRGESEEQNSRIIYRMSCQSLDKILNQNYPQI